MKNEIKLNDYCFHMCFGERKERIKIFKKGKMGCRSHFWKKDPLFYLNNFSNQYNFISNFYNLNQQNTNIRLQKLIFLNNINLNIQKKFFLFCKKQKKFKLRPLLQNIINFFETTSQTIINIKAKTLLNQFNKKRKNDKPRKVFFKLNKALLFNVKNNKFIQKFNTEIKNENENEIIVNKITPSEEILLSTLDSIKNFKPSKKLEDKNFLLQKQEKFLLSLHKIHLTHPRNLKISKKDKKRKFIKKLINYEKNNSI